MVDDIDAVMPTRADLRRYQRTRSQPDIAAQPQPDSSSRPASSTAVESRPRLRSRLRALPDLDDDLRAAQRHYDDSESVLRQAEILTAQPYRSYNTPRTPQLFSLNRWLLLAVVALASVLVLARGGGGSTTSLTRWSTLLNFGDNSMSGVSRASLFGSAHPPGDYTIQGKPSLTVQEIDAILTSYGSPAAGTGKIWYDLGIKYGIDPAYPVAFFIHESSAGTNPGWAGLKQSGGSTHNVGNIICAGYATCYGRFRDYRSWEEGIEDWYRLIDVEYIKGRGTRTVQDIVPIYAPSFENDVQAYINAVTGLIDGWRTHGIP
ncbi:MAG: hypothetical protein HGA19_16195 [Oscillochloris sp.]|nr:hypothetical protein [Oscillochloris sp.]